jgi:hypothetical protein
VKFDGKAAAYDELMESEFGMKDEMLECEVWNELRCRAWWAALPERLEELEHNKLSSMMTEGLGIEHGRWPWRSPPPAPGCRSNASAEA